MRIITKLEEERNVFSLMTMIKLYLQVMISSPYLEIEFVTIKKNGWQIQLLILKMVTVHR